MVPALDRLVLIVRSAAVGTDQSTLRNPIRKTASCAAGLAANQTLFKLGKLANLFEKDQFKPRDCRPDVHFDSQTLQSFKGHVVQARVRVVLLH